MENQKQAYIYGITAIIFWSTAATAFKIGLRHMDFIQLIFYASAVSAIICAVIATSTGKISEIKAVNGRQLLWSAFTSLLNPFGYYIILLKAYSILPAQIAQPLNYTWPVMLVFLSIPLLGQKIGIKSIIAILISFSGVFFISLQGNTQSLKIDEPFGVGLALSSSVVWALFWIFNVKDNRSEIVKLFFNFVFGTFYLFLAVLFFSDFAPENVSGFYAAIYVGFFELGITFFLWLKALQKTEKTDKISNLVFVSPFLSLIFIALILGEKIYETTVIGLVLIVSGIILQQVLSKK